MSSVPFVQGDRTTINSSMLGSTVLVLPSVVYSVYKVCFFVVKARRCS